jgi:hypothetical protein
LVSFIIFFPKKFGLRSVRRLYVVHIIGSLFLLPHFLFSGSMYGDRPELYPIVVPFAILVFYFIILYLLLWISLKYDHGNDPKK